VPPTYRNCWLAGGGSTVRGVDPDAGLEPFVATDLKGEPGTVVIMADGKVRFLKASTPKETFLALCTIAGGEAIDNLDDIAPEIKGKAVAKKPDLPPPPPAPPRDDRPKPPQDDKPAPQDKKDTKPTPPAPPAPPGGGATSAGLPRQTKMNDLKELGVAFHSHVSTNNRGPAKLEDLAPFYNNDAKMTERLKEGIYVFYWNVNPTSLTQGTSNTVLAYEADAPSKGGAVLMADGSVKRMTAEEFQAAPKAGR
jgi:hypothetical protein